MLPEDLPCLGDCQWQFNGAHIGGELNVEGFYSPGNHKRSHVFSGMKQRPLMVVYSDTKEMADLLDAYLNGPFLAHWRLACNEDRLAGAPPELPEGFQALEWNKPSTSWVEVDTKGVVAPEDPTLTKHRKYWTTLLAQMGVRNYRTVKNEYCDTHLEPWYEFQLYNCTWTVGPRKQVDVIEVLGSVKMNFSALEAVTKKDQSTFYLKQPDGKFGVGCHAWTREKFLEYFYLTLSAVAAKAPRDITSLQTPEPAQFEAPTAQPLDMKAIYEDVTRNLAERLGLLEKP